MNKAEAQALWTRVWETLADHQAAIVEVIRTKAWEPLGYESFVDAWLDTRRDEITLDAELRPHVQQYLASARRCYPRP